MSKPLRITAAWLLGWAALLACLAPVAWSQEAAPGGARAFMVADEHSGHILLQSHATDKLQIASLTKLATAAVVLDWVRLDNHSLDTSASIPRSIIAAHTNNPIGFQEGDEISLRDLLYASLVQSDAVATDALAAFVGRELPPVTGENEVKNGRASTVRFVAQMNALARKLRMERTRFLNPLGGDETERPYSTAADVARLSRYAFAKADFRFFVAQRERRITFRRAGANVDYLLRNTNELLGQHGVDGGKTGTSDRAGQCLMVTSERPAIVRQEGAATLKTTRRLVVVVLGSPNRFREAVTLIELGQAAFDRWLAAGSVPTAETNL